MTVRVAEQESDGAVLPVNVPVYVVVCEGEIPPFEPEGAGEIAPML